MYARYNVSRTLYVVRCTIYRAGLRNVLYIVIKNCDIYSTAVKGGMSIF